MTRRSDLSESDEALGVPTFSVLIGRVSTEDHDRILETLQALRAQREPCPYEVIIVDRRDDEVTARIEAAFPEARLERCEAAATLPEMRRRPCRR